MKDKEIIEALECCQTSGLCAYCPLKSDKKFCVNFLTREALNFIIRQKAEIDRLRYNLKAVLDERAETEQCAE